MIPKSKIISFFLSIISGVLFGIVWTYVKDFMVPSNIFLALLKINNIFIFVGIPLLIIGLMKKNKTSLGVFWIVVAVHIIMLLLYHKNIFKELVTKSHSPPPMYEILGDLFISCIFGIVFFFTLFVKEIEVYKILKKEKN